MLTTHYGYLSLMSIPKEERSTMEETIELLNQFYDAKSKSEKETILIKILPAFTPKERALLMETED